jgi:hypothetical protein
MKIDGAPLSLCDAAIKSSSCKQCAFGELRFLYRGQCVGEKQGFGAAFDSVAAMRAFDDAKFVRRNDSGAELIDLERFTASCTLALHEFHSTLTL